MMQAKRRSRRIKVTLKSLLEGHDCLIELPQRESRLS